jgi:hypothetical protein
MIDFFLVGILWGCTTPFLRTQDSKKSDDRPKSTFSHLRLILTDIRFLTAFLLNQAGSIFFYRLLSIYSLAIAAAGANALAFVFSALTETLFISKRLPDPRTSLGASMIVLGLYICNSI